MGFFDGMWGVFLIVVFFIFCLFTKNIGDDFGEY